MLHNIRIVLVETTHSGNIGSVARAMKTMGLAKLILVKPVAKIDVHAATLAANARDIVTHANILPTLEEAISECSLVLGTSARKRNLKWPLLNPRECASHCVVQAKSAPVAIVFGRERTGLFNEELQQCHYQVSIPTHEQYSSLNLAMAVQILCYEIWQAYSMLDTHMKENYYSDLNIYPTVKDLNNFYYRFQQLLYKTEFIHNEKQGKIMARLRCLFTRSHLDKRELNILQGILMSINKLMNE